MSLLAFKGVKYIGRETTSSTSLFLLWCIPIQLLYTSVSGGKITGGRPAALLVIGVSSHPVLVALEEMQSGVSRPWIPLIATDATVISDRGLEANDMKVLGDTDQERVLT